MPAPMGEQIDEFVPPPPHAQTHRVSLTTVWVASSAKRGDDVRAGHIFQPLKPTLPEGCTRAVTRDLLATRSRSSKGSPCCCEDQEGTMTNA